MIRLTIASAEVRQGGLTNGRGEPVGWSVVQGGGGLILAYCDTQQEADKVVAWLRSHATMSVSGAHLAPHADTGEKT